MDRGRQQRHWSADSRQRMDELIDEYRTAVTFDDIRFTSDRLIDLRDGS